jgi:4-amino-4-deoxy-L-arabinose transferase-like glycosyltransferase
MTESDNSYPRRAVNLLLALFAAGYLLFLGRYPLIDPDEPVYAETGRLMASAHSFAAWWTPCFNGAMWFDKPPVTYWLIGLAMKLLGATEFAARLPMALAGIALVALTARLAWRLYPDRPNAAAWAAFAIGTCAQTLVLAHACVTDMLFVLALTAALLAAWEWLGGGGWRSALLAGLAVGAGAMIKGPVAIVLMGAQLAIVFAVRREMARLLGVQFWAAVAVAVSVAAPWYVSMILLHGQTFVRGFLEAQNVTRFLSAEHSATASPLFFVPVLVAGFLPWSIPLIPALANSFRRARAGQGADTFALIWLTVVFVFFSASQSKLVTYIYPLYPMAACVTANWIATRSNRGARIAVAAVAGAFLVAIPIVAAQPMWLHPDPKSLSAVEMGRIVAANSKPSDTVYALTFNKPSLVFYSERKIVFTDDQELVGPILSRPPYPICVTMPDIITSLERKHDLADFRILAQLRNRVVLIRCIPPAGSADQRGPTPPGADMRSDFSGTAR